MPTVSDAWPALLLMGFIVSLPWLAGLVRKSGWQGLKPPTSSMKVVSAMAIGPQQRIVTVEVGSGTHKKLLVLGVTSQSITKLDTLQIDSHLDTESTLHNPTSSNVTHAKKHPSAS